MVEARTRIPGCEGLKLINGKFTNWLDEVPPDAHIRLFRALLPTVLQLPHFHWQDDFDEAFRGTTSPCEVLDVSFGEDVDDSVLSMFQAVPALKKIEIGCDDGIPGAKAALHIIIKAFREGSLQQLEEVTLRNFTLDEGDVKEFLGMLEDFGCAKRLVHFGSEGYHVNVPKGLGFLAELLGRDAFPALERLEISGTPLFDVGVVALAEGLLRTRQTVLTNLVLKNVGMADKGMAAVASLVSQGLMKELEVLDI